MGSIKRISVLIAVLLFFSVLPKPALAGSWFTDWKDKIVYYHDLLEKLIFLPDLPAAPKRINILILGLDGRRGQRDRRADAIHLMTLLPYQGRIRITSIPRGTMSEKIMEGKEIIANTYSIDGRDGTIKAVEDYLEVHVDYYIVVGFSEAEALFEKLGYNGEKTLQVLRSRKAYGIGDPQRSHNQAFFIASEIMRNYPYFKQYPTLGRALLFVAHEIIETNVPFEVMVQVSDLYLTNGLNDITLLMKPEDYMSSLKDIKFTPETIDAVLNEQKKSMEKNEEAQKDMEEMKEKQEEEAPMSQYLSGIINYNKRFLGKEDRKVISRAGPYYGQKLWYQVKDKGLSEKLHFQFMELLYQAYFNLGEYDRARSTAQGFMDERSLDLINRDYQLQVGEMIKRCEERLYADRSGH
ncbi:MAG: LCP family protein [Deltaproteobacteria bacterium]|nr:LCP family protein [Candidatus Zymogenaceae bacterium]